MSTLSKDTATTLPVVLTVVGVMGFLTMVTSDQSVTLSGRSAIF